MAELCDDQDRHGQGIGCVVSTARALEVTEHIMHDLTEASELRIQAAIEKLHAATNSKAEAIAYRLAGDEAEAIVVTAVPLTTPVVNEATPAIATSQPGVSARGGTSRFAPAPAAAAGLAAET